MTWLKRIGLFIILNFLVITSVTLVLSFFNVQPYLTRHGLNIYALMTFCFIWGMAGAFISLALSKMSAKWMMGLKMIKADESQEDLKRVYDFVKAQAQKLGIKTPEVGVFASDEPNAFATGPTRNRSLVAVSNGLLRHLSQQEIEAVIGHEMSHINNGDMVTMTLLQGVVNAFVLFLSRIFAYAITAGRGERGSAAGYFLFTLLFQIVFMILGSMVVAAYSRYREFKADAGGASLTSKNAMAAALMRLKAHYEEQQKVQHQSKQAVPESMQAFMISDKTKRALSLFASHPPLEDRIARLQDIS